MKTIRITITVDLIRDSLIIFWYHLNQPEPANHKIIVHPRPYLLAKLTKLATNDDKGTVTPLICGWRYTRYPQLHRKGES